ncbi:hypothetical protein P152DRAFT_185528 [Eremomyces bilateralis CBS 781.70]|uniref:DUF7053 domain-containing protein n=1 Tax=Eremomyces bilateralis CBS 781.70 TaxID=1392243 RepID=A0A6G1GBG4_9PEZI|nr:uncharacterized protein P152DRAFT_185528 [Eremomyces bilateralis CBS 781.70]KAF1815438.1 hypothetical protein P152DRAFT_185528 [Eremomyces bilateralis CBS 781.70]
MSKRTVFTHITPLPAGLSRATVMETLHNHFAMIDLNPLVIGRVPCEPPVYATPEELHCKWYAITDLIHYLPGGAISGKLTYHGCFHDLDNGLQTHVFAPMGLNIKGKWTLGGSLPGEPRPIVELGIDAPKEGLYLREDVDMKCNIMMTSFVKKTLKKAHSGLVDTIIAGAPLSETRKDGPPGCFTGAGSSSLGAYGYPVGYTGVDRPLPELPPSHPPGVGSAQNFPAQRPGEMNQPRPYPHDKHPAELPGSN